MKEVQIKVSALSLEEVIAVVDKIDALMSAEFNGMGDVERAVWKEQAVKLLRANGNESINIDFNYDGVANALSELASACEAVLTIDEEEEIEPLTAEELEELSASDETSVAEENTKEEETVEKEQEFSVETLVATLIASGMEPEMAVATANKVAQEKSIKEAEVAPVEEPVEAPKANVPEWFKAAVEKLNAPTKTALAGQLATQYMKVKTDNEKKAIEKEIKRLQDKDGQKRFDHLMSVYIAEARGWTKDENGKVADWLYSTGDVVQKSTSGVTRGIGKATTWTGEKITKAGQALENNADAAGAIARKPFDAMGSGANKISSKADEKKKEKEAKKAKEQKEKEKKEALEKIKKAAEKSKK